MGVRKHAFPIRKDAMRAVRCVVAVVACVAALAAPARAFADAPTIAYDGNARQLTVSAATDSSGEPDLFLAFKDLMPGDVRDQQIEIRATGVSPRCACLCVPLSITRRHACCRPLP